MARMNHTIAVAVSGGVDSMVAAHLLKQDHPNVIGLHFLTGFETAPADSSAPAVQSIGEQVGIPVHVVDLSADFRRNVVDYFSSTYLAGETPNPCVVCNPSIKFGVLLRFAQGLGADEIATGHYAIVQRESSGRYRLLKGVDSRKDQSYFLARLTQAQLAKARFPLGALTKAAVRQIAARRGLKPAASSESQDVCFIKGESNYSQFIAGLSNRLTEPGLIETTGGEVIGEHRGLHAFTIGQRRGINCPAAAPYYVVRLDTARNRLVVGPKKDLLAAECRVARINWVHLPPQEPVRVQARVRYRTRESPATLTPLSEDSAQVSFDSPQSAVTPGQAAVFYDGDEVLGGGFITKA
ncbi:MAG: tRNA 2-thiouridine(34) synthase MnmA [Hyphomicrobiales bacterium]